MCSICTTSPITEQLKLNQFVEVDLKEFNTYPLKIEKTPTHTETEEIKPDYPDCCVCYDAKATIQCPRCKNHPACITCLSKFINKGHHTPKPDGYYRTYPYKFDEIRFHQFFIECPLCRHKIYVKITDPKLSREDILRFYQVDSLTLQRLYIENDALELENKRLRKLNDTKDTAEYIDQYKKEFIIDHKDEIDYHIDLFEIEQEINKQKSKEILELKKEIENLKLLKKENAELKYNYNILNAYCIGLSGVIEEYKTYIRRLFNNISKLTKINKLKFLNALDNTKFKLTIDGIADKDNNIIFTPKYQII